MGIVMWAFLLCYVIVALVLLFKEKRQYKNNTAIPLERCDPSHTHKYKITVYTGHHCGAGTSAKVAVVLYGENGSSSPVELFTRKRKVFRANSRDVFVASVQENLGDINFIHLWHDNSGSSPSWFVDRLIIKDLSSSKKWIFRCCKWLAVDRHSGVLGCKIKPFDHSNYEFTLKEFGLLLGEKLMDFHIWLSLFRMPTYSMFTRAERLTCCVTLMFAYLFFNAYFCCHNREVATIDCLSVFNPTWLQFKVGIISTVSCLPIYLLFNAMFRHTKSFVYVQPARNTKVLPDKATSKVKPSINEPSRSEKVAEEMNRWSDNTYRGNLLKVAAVLVKSFSDEDETPDLEYSYSDEEITTYVHTKPPSRSPPRISRNCANVDNELSSETSGSLHFQRLNSFRLPTCFNILLWVGCIVFSIVSLLCTVEYVSRYDCLAVRCYIQSVFWSLFISVCISQPFQAFIMTVVEMVRRCFTFHGEIVDEPGEEMEQDVVLDNSMFACFTEKNFEDPLYRKLFCLKYLQPLSRKAVARAMRKLERRKTTVMFIREILIYFLLLLILCSLNPFWNQKCIILHNDGLKNALIRDVDTSSSLLTWWRTGPQKFINNLTFGNPTITAFRHQAVVVGDPKLTMTVSYCYGTKSVLYEIRTSLQTESKSPCTKVVEENTANLGKTQKEHWSNLSASFHKQFSEYVTEISLQFVIYAPSMHAYSLVNWSSHTIHMLRTLHVRNDVSITTVNFYVDRTTFSFQTFCQMLFTLVPVLLIICQLCYTKNKKRQTSLAVKIEFLIIFLSIFSVILMWIWIKSQYIMLGHLLTAQFEANIINEVQTNFKHQELFKFFVAFTLFFVVIKVCHVIGLDQLFDGYIETFTSVISSVLFPLFGLLIVFVGFAHMGVLLFGDQLKTFGTFLQAFALNVMYLRMTGSENLVLDSPYEQMLLAIYVVAFCVCMILFSNLVRAAFCQAGVNVLLTVNMPIKWYFVRRIKRIFTLLRSYVETPEEEKICLRPLLMKNLYKELDEQLNNLEFRFTHLVCKHNMPAKAVPQDSSSSDDSDVEHICTGSVERASFSSIQHNLSSSSSKHFEYPDDKNIANSNVESDIMQQSSASSSVTTQAENKVSLTRRRPFESMRAFPTPINDRSSGHPQVLLDAFVNEEDFEENSNNTLGFYEHHTAPDDEESVGDGKISKDTKVSSLRTFENDNNHRRSGVTNALSPKLILAATPKDLYGKCKGKQNKGGTRRPWVFFNDGFEDKTEQNDHFTPRRPKVRLDAFEDSFEDDSSLNEDDYSFDDKKKSESTVGISSEKRAESVYKTTKEDKPLIPRQRAFQLPTFPLSINHLFTKSSEV